eukprot:4480003-Pleurochrysis_carterae.AAC.1
MLRCACACRPRSAARGCGVAVLQSDPSFASCRWPRGLRSQPVPRRSSPSDHPEALVCVFWGQ